MHELFKILETTLLDVGKIQITLYNVVFLALLIIISRIVLGLFKRFLKMQQENGKIDYGQSFSIYQIFKYIIIVILIIIILDSLNINITILVAGSAAFFVGIGLGMQHIFNDIISGFILLFGRTIKVDDVVDVGGIVGKVIKVGFRTSTIITRDDIDLIVPNSKFISNNVINWSHSNENTRFRLKVGVAYGSDTELVKSVLLQCALTHPEVIKDREPIVRFADFGESELSFELLFWSNNIFRIERVLSDLRFEVDKKFRENNITIPFPQRDVWFKNKE